MNCLLTIKPTEVGGYEVSLQIDDGAVLSSKFGFNPDGKSLQKAFNEIQVVSCPRDQITAIGQQLFQGTIPKGELLAAFHAALEKRSEDERKLRIRLRLVTPPELRWLPWESLFDKQLLHLATNKNWTLYHEPAPEERELVEFPGEADGILKVLIVVPVQTNLDFTKECQAITYAIGRLGPNARVEKMPGAVTLRALNDKLAEDNWDIVHYIGHGVLESREGKGVSIFLNSSAVGGEAYVGESQFALSFQRSGVRLVVLSCCFGGGYTASQTQSLSGLGPYLLRAGVPAVVAMRYVVSDTAAMEFSSAFYTALVGVEAGQIDCAVQAGRVALACLTGESENRAFITPVLYAAPERTVLAVPREEAAPIAPVIPPVAGTAISLPPVLDECLQKGKCLILAGGRLAHVGASRDLAVAPALPPTFDTLARELAPTLASAYPRAPEFDLLKTDDDGGAWEAFERFCQYFKSCREGGRLRLERHVGDSFGNRRAPEVFRLMAEWRVAGILYTHFDGYLREAAKTVGDWEIKENPSLDVLGDRRALVLLRGSPSDRATLRMTKEDAWEVLLNVSHMSPSVKKLAREGDGAVLLLGVAPSDGLVQFLVNILISDESQRRETPIFFASREPEPVVRACWHRFQNLVWLGDHPLDELVRTIDSIVLKEP